MTGAFQYCFATVLVLCVQLSYNYYCNLITSYAGCVCQFLLILKQFSQSYNKFRGSEVTECSNILYYTVILCHKLVFLVLVRLIVIKNFNHTINRD